MAERADQIYQALLDTGFSEEELNKQITEKLTEYQGFMTKQAVLFLIAKENGINIYSSKYNNEIQKELDQLIDYNDYTIPISSISEGMQNIVIVGRITQVFGIKSFIRKDGTSGKVGSFQICDKSECIKIVIWNEQTRIMENDFFQNGEVIQIIGGYSNRGIDDNLEVNLNRQGKLILAPEGIILPESNIHEHQNLSNEKDVKSSSKLTIEELHKKMGFIKFVKGIVKVDEFKELNLKSGEKSFLLKLILSDESGSIKVNIWGMSAIDCVKTISDGDYIKISNLIIKENSYSNEKELSFTKSSRIEII
ncbi:MAG: hypothetical protein ACFE9X_16375 [Promethearchaeota archaeon]